MRKICELCAKKTMVGRNRSHAQNRTPRKFVANIQKVTMVWAESKISGNFCTKCIKKLHKEMDAQKTALV